APCSAPSRPLPAHPVLLAPATTSPPWIRLCRTRYMRRSHGSACLTPARPRSRRCGRYSPRRMSWLSEGMPKYGRRASPNPALHLTGAAIPVFQGSKSHSRPRQVSLAFGGGGATVAKKKRPKTAPLMSVLHVGSMHPATPRYSVQRPTWKQIEDAILQMDGH